MESYNLGKLGRVVNNSVYEDLRSKQTDAWVPTTGAEDGTRPRHCLYVDLAVEAPFPFGLLSRS